MKPILLILALFSVFLSHAWADRTADPGKLSEDLDRLLPAPSRAADTDVQRELECIQGQARRRFDEELSKARVKQAAAVSAGKDAASVPLPPSPDFISPEASAMIRHLAKPMQRAFDDFKVNSFERVFFYAQAIEESGGFTMLSESRKLERTGVDPIGTVIANASNDELFKTKAGAKASREFGVYRGRGIVQISRCDNYLAVIHYLNRHYAGKKAVWKADWDVADGAGKRKKLETVCRESDIRAFLSEYKNRYGGGIRSGNLYGVLDDPVRFAMVNAELVDPDTKDVIDSEKFMIDASLAFWRGRCVDSPEKALNPRAVRELCAGEDADDFTNAVKCLTRCVRGTNDGWKKRLAWMKDAMLCVKL